jgi:TolB-like protein
MFRSARSFNFFPIGSLLITVGPLILFLYGCGPRHYINPYITDSEVTKIAVLPFTNLTESPFAHQSVRSKVIIELLSRGYEVTEPGEVSRILNDLYIKAPASLSKPDLQRIGESLGVDSVMKGSVGAYGISKGISVSFPEVSLHLMLLDAPSGNIKWYVWHSAGGPSFWTRHFGAEGKTLDETTFEVVKKAVDTLK